MSPPQKAMCYNRRNQIDRIIAVQNLTLEHTSKGVTQEWIYENLIRPVFFISKRTYYNYLASNARRDLRQAEQRQLQYS